MSKEQLVQSLSGIINNDNSHFFFYGGLISRNGATKLLSEIDDAKQNTSSTKLTLVVATMGGDPDAAYIIGRRLQEKYEEITIVVDGFCKSSGTLLALAAHRLIITETGELGPLDIQIIDKRENQQSSTQDTFHALTRLRSESMYFFHQSFDEINQGARLSLAPSLRTASTIATEILKPIYEQIDPNKLGEMSRATQIATFYGERLNSVSKNLKEESVTLAQLISHYPSHGFVIDQKEAQEKLFNRVEPASESLTYVLSKYKISVNEKLCSYGGDSLILDFNKEREKLKEELKQEKNGLVGNVDRLDIDINANPQESKAEEEVNMKKKKEKSKP